MLPGALCFEGPGFFCIYILISFNIGIMGLLSA